MKTIVERSVMLDPIAEDRVERELVDLTERRGLRADGEQQHVEDLFEETTRRHREARQEELRTAWADYHREQAERLRQTMTVLVEQHEEAAARLMLGWDNTDDRGRTAPRS